MQLHHIARKAKLKRCFFQLLTPVSILNFTKVDHRSEKGDLVQTLFV